MALSSFRSCGCRDLRQGPQYEVDDAAAEKMQSDKRMQPPAGGDMPFDATRVIYGDFTPVE